MVKFIDEQGLICKSAKEGDKAFLSFLLSCGAQVDNSMGLEASPLQQAAGQGNLGIVKLLLEHGAHVNKENNLGYTALHYTTQGGYLDVIKLLLENKADFNEQDKGSAKNFFRNKPDLINPLNDKELLHLAAKTKAFNFLTFLLECKLIPKKKTLLGTTPLHQALEADQIDLVKILLAQGEDFNEEYQHTSLRLDNCPNLVQRLSDNYLAHHAIIAGAKNFLSFMIDCGVNVNQKTLSGNTLLHQAVKENQFDTVKFLLEKRADINAKNAQGETPIYLDTQGINLQIVKLLLDNSADVNIKNNSGELPLHCASQEGYCNIMRLLLKHGASINDKKDSDNLSINPDNNLENFSVLKVYLSQLEKVEGHGYSAFCG